MLPSSNLIHSSPKLHLLVDLCVILYEMEDYLGESTQYVVALLHLINDLISSWMLGSGFFYFLHIAHMLTID